MTKTKKTFEIGRIKLNLRSGNYFTTYVNKITPPEFLMLQDLHGEHAPLLIEVQGKAVKTRYLETGKKLQRGVSRGELIEKLTLKYGEIRFKEVFPGKNPILPYDFDSIEIEADKGYEEKVLAGSAEDETDWEEVEEEEVKTPSKPAAKAQTKKPADDLVGKTI